MKKVLFIVAIVIGLLIINNLARSTYDLWSKRDVISSAKSQLEAEKKENQSLKNQLNKAKDGQFVEEEARNKLLLVKPGEQNVFVPKDLNASDSSQIKIDTRPNWQKWWDLFF